MSWPVNRLKHCHGVGKKMAESVKQCPWKYEPCTPEEAYTLGLLHDFAYEFAGQQEGHAHMGGLILKQAGYKYWREVYYHSAMQNEYDSRVLTLLYFADMVVGPAGEEMTAKQRIDDIAIRYGKESSQYRETVELAEMLADNGFPV